MKKTALKIVYESYNVYVYLIKVKVVFTVITINAYIILNCVTAKSFLIKNCLGRRVGFFEQYKNATCTNTCTCIILDPRSTPT